ncbi:MAG: ATP-binding protein [Vicinamibacterales bacterium]
MTSDSPPEGGFTLARVSLRGDYDLVALSRQTRAAGDELGLHARDVRGLSAATYEAARTLVGHEGLEAEVRLADGPSLQVVFRIPIADAARHDAVCLRVSEAIAPLRGLAHEVRVEESGSEVHVCLRALFPMGAAARLQDWATPRVARGSAREPRDIPQTDLRQRYADLDQAFHDLQFELQETNRGVVALHAELEAHTEELRQAEDRLRLLLDSVQDYAICMLTPQGEIASWNAGAQRLFGYAAEEIVGRPFGCFYQAAERDQGVPGDHLRLADERGRVACECLRMRQGGTIFDAHVVLTAVRRGRERELHGFSLVVRDITERKRLEDDLRRRAEDLAAANRAKEDFLATLSHELRTPLNAMLGWTRLLRTGKLDKTARSRALETIERNAHIQEQLIADILDVSRIVTGRLRLELRPMELAPVVEASLDAVRPASEAKGVRLVANPGFEGTVLGDRNRLQQVVWNLLVNAIKFTPAGGTVTIGIARLGTSAAITVSETGEGISPGLLPFIFDRFMQADTSATRPHGGLGLGLSIVRHVVELHGGKVHAHSEGRGRGATFSVHLPIRAIQHAAVEPDRESHPLLGV